MNSIINKPHLWNLSDSLDEFHIFNNENLNLDFRAVFKFIELVQKTEFNEAMRVVGMHDHNNLGRLVEMIQKRRFGAPKSDDIMEQMYAAKQVTDDEYKRYREDLEREVYFDINADSDTLYYDFKKMLNIDLVNDKVNYFIFIQMINLIQEDESSATHKRIQARLFKPTKGKGNEAYNAIGRRRRSTYELFENVEKESSSLMEVLKGGK